MSRRFFVWTAIECTPRPRRRCRLFWTGRSADRDEVRFVVAEAEHGYASSLPAHDERCGGGRRPKTKKSQGSR